MEPWQLALGQVEGRLVGGTGVLDLGEWIPGAVRIEMASRGRGDRRNWRGRGATGGAPDGVMRRSGDMRVRRCHESLGLAVGAGGMRRYLGPGGKGG